MNTDESKTICIRLPIELAQWIQKQAKNNIRPVSYEIRKLIEESRKAHQS